MIQMREHVQTELQDAEDQVHQERDEEWWHWADLQEMRWAQQMRERDRRVAEAETAFKVEQDIALEAEYRMHYAQGQVTKMEDYLEENERLRAWCRIIGKAPPWLGPFPPHSDEVLGAGDPMRALLAFLLTTPP